MFKDYMGFLITFLNRLYNRASHCKKNETEKPRAVSSNDFSKCAVNKNTIKTKATNAVKLPITKKQYKEKLLYLIKSNILFLITIKHEMIKANISAEQVGKIEDLLIQSKNSVLVIEKMNTELPSYVFTVKIAKKHALLIRKLIVLGLN